MNLYGPCFILTCLVTSLLFTGHSSAEEMFDVYILTGQSNSLGTTRFDGDVPADYGPGTDESDQRVSFFWSNVHASNTVYPPQLYGDSDGEIVTLRMQQGDDAHNPAFWGPEFGFARTIAPQSKNKVLIIKASRGGGGNSYWDPSVFEKDKDDGHMWKHLCDTVDAGLKALSDRGEKFQIRGVIYLQGESNSLDNSKVAGRRLKDLYTALTEHIKNQYEGTTRQVKLVIGEIAASDKSRARQLTTQQQQELAKADAQINFIRTNDLPLQPDNIHFGRKAKLEIGERIAEAFHRLNLAEKIEQEQ